MDHSSLKTFFDKKVDEYNQPFFIEHDPISIPHRFTSKQDREIAGLFAAIMAWGNRQSIINSCNRLLALMDNAPADFIKHFREKDLKPFTGFVHRTFNATDLFHFLNVLQYHYKTTGNDSLETAFSRWMNPGDPTTENALNGFHVYFFSKEVDPDFPARTVKHIAAPFRKSACKRLNMYLRWMVRKDGKGVDFGHWNRISPSQLVCPIDLHVARVARRFSLLQRKQTDWLAARELTEYLRTFDAEDPVKYDFALFGLGVLDKY
jgi:uncharacterized protein (TIGR02757 family)